MSGKVPSRVRIARTQRNTPKYAGKMNQEGLMNCGFGRNRVLCQKIKSRTATAPATVPAPAPAGPTYVSSNVPTANPDIIYITFSENIVAGGTVTATDFTINGTFVTTPTIIAAGIETVTGKIAIELSLLLHNTDTLTITFNKTTSTFGNAAGGQVASFGPETVTNNVISPPGAPTALTATVPAQDSNTYGGGGGVSLSWTEPLNNGGSTILSYEYQVTENGTPGGWLTFNPNIRASTGIVPNLTFGSTFTFKVRALNTFFPGVESSASNSVVPSVTVPAKPHLVVMSAGTATGPNQGVKLTYFSPTDGGQTITDYQYQQSTAGGPFGLWTALDITGAASGSVCFDMITGLTNGTTYTYKVRASNDGGTSWSTISDNATRILAPTPIPTNTAFFEAIDDWLGTVAEKLAVTTLYGSIEDWNTALITDMSSAFENGRNTHQGLTLDSQTFNDDISGWDTWQVDDMSGMFSGCNLFNNNGNSNINLWNTGGVSDMSYMFIQCSVFNQPIGWWVVQNVLDMSYMFRSATNFNQEISRWELASVTDMSYMFKSATNFNNGTGTFLAWGLTSVLTLESMFEGAINFNQTLIWTINAQCNTFKSMFKEANSFNGTLEWNQANAGAPNLSAEEMFYGASSFTGLGLPGWQTTGLVGRLGNLKKMFNNAAAFNQDLSGWRFVGITGVPTNFNTNGLNEIFHGATALATNNVTYGDGGTPGTPTALTWKDTADYVYGLRLVAGYTDIPLFYENGDDYDGSASTATQFPKITA